MSLYGHKFRKSFFFCQSVRLGKLVGITVGNTDISRLACFHHIVQPFHNVIERRRVIPQVINIQIHIIHPKVLKALIDHLLYMLLCRHSLFNLLRCAGKKFRSDYNIFSLCKVFERTSKILLTRTALIPDCRIVKIDARLQSPADNLAGVSLIYRPCVLTVSSVSKSHTAHTDTGYIQVRVA